MKSCTIPEVITELTDETTARLMRHGWRLLSRRQRMHLKLYFKEGWTYKRIADFHGTSIGRVGHVIKEAVSTLRRYTLSQHPEVKLREMKTAYRKRLRDSGVIAPGHCFNYEI